MLCGEIPLPWNSITGQPHVLQELNVATGQWPQVCTTVKQTYEKPGMLPLPQEGPLCPLLPS